MTGTRGHRSRSATRDTTVREALWTEAAAIGSRSRIENVAVRLPESRYEIEPVPALDAGVAESSGTYVLRLSNRVREGLPGILEPRDKLG